MPSATLSPQSHRRLVCIAACLCMSVPHRAHASEPAQPVVHRKPRPIPDGAVTSDWPRFLGPTHNAVSPETNLRIDWPDDGPPLVWEVPTGAGYATPAIRGNRLVLFHRLGDEEIVECRHAETGAVLWAHSYPSQYKDRYGFNNGPRSSPVIDGNRVFTVGAEGSLHCFALDNGKVQWQRDIYREHKVPQDFFGVAASPLVDGDHLLLNIGAPGGPCVIALDKRSGKTRWGAGDQWGPSYASPIPAVVHGKPRVFVFAGGDSNPPTGGLLGIDPTAGKLLFRFPWRSKNYESVNAASPVVFGDRVLITASYKTGGALLRILPDDSHKVVWTTDDLACHWMTPLVRDGHAYAFSGRHANKTPLICVDLADGNVIWKKVLEWKEAVPVRGNEQEMTFTPQRATLLHADGHALCLGEEGHLLWLDLSPDGVRILARARLFLAPETWGLPPLSRGLLYVNQNAPDRITRAGPRLRCYDLRGE